MDIYSQTRLIPQNQESCQFTPKKPIISRSVAVSGNPGPKRLELIHSSRAASNLNQPDDQEFGYSSMRRHNFSQLDRVGLFVDIYA